MISERFPTTSAYEVIRHSISQCISSYALYTYCMFDAFISLHRRGFRRRIRNLCLHTQRHMHNTAHKCKTYIITKLSMDIFQVHYICCLCQEIQSFEVIF